MSDAMRAADKLTADLLLSRVLQDLGAPAERLDEGAYLVTLPAAPRPVPTYLLAGDHGVTVEAFFLRRPPERAGEVHAFVLGRNARTIGVHFSLDPIGDVYLTGLLPYDGLTGTLLDRVLGQVVTHVDECFVPCVEVGYASALAGEAAAKARTDGAGRRPADTPDGAPRHDPRR